MNVVDRPDVGRQGKQRKKFARAPRRNVPFSPRQRLELVARLHGDPRYRALKPRAQHCIGLAVTDFADGEGKWWHKTKAWAAAAGVSPATLKRAMREAEEAGLLTREPYLRPDGKQGSTTYKLDEALVETRRLNPEPPCRKETRKLTPEPPEQEKNHNRSKRKTTLESEGPKTTLLEKRPESVKREETELGGGAASGSGRMRGAVNDALLRRVRAHDAARAAAMRNGGASDEADRGEAHDL